MLLAYVDESFSRDWYFMAALVCDGSGVKAITAGLDAVVAKAVTAHGVPADPELHGYELFNGTGSWTDVPPRIRIAVYNEAFEVIAEHCQGVILRGVHTPGLARRYTNPYTPQSAVLKDLLVEINKFAARRSEQVLIIADEVGEQARHRSDVALYRVNGTWGYASSTLGQIIDTLHFAPSTASRLLQAVDLVVFLYRRMETHTEPNEKAARANEALWARMKPKVARKKIWYPAGRP